MCPNLLAALPEKEESLSRPLREWRGHTFHLEIYQVKAKKALDSIRRLCCCLFFNPMSSKRE